MPAPDSTTGQPTRGRRLAAAAISASFALAALTACTTDAPAPELPAGWVQHTEGRASFALPATWTAEPITQGSWTVGWTDASAPGAAALIISPEFATTGGAAGGGDLFMVSATLGGFGFATVESHSPDSTKTLEVDRINFTQNSPDGATEDGVFWAAANPDTGFTVGLKLYGADLPTDLVDTIQSSLVVLDKAPAANS